MTDKNRRSNNHVLLDRLDDLRSAAMSKAATIKALALLCHSSTHVISPADDTPLEWYCIFTLFESESRSIEESLEEMEMLILDFKHKGAAGV